MLNISTYLKMGFNMGGESLTAFLEMARELGKTNLNVDLFLSISEHKLRIFGVYVLGALSRNM